MAQKNLVRRARRIETLFYISVVAIPVINFIVLQFYVNYIDVFLFSIKKYDYSTATYRFTSDVFYNFRNFFHEITTDPRWKSALWVTFKGYLVGWIVDIPISIVIPYFICKKYFGSKFFKFILMMPQMISSMVWTLIYLNFTENALVVLFNWEMGPISNPSTRWITMQIKSTWIGVAGSMLMYTGIFSGVSDAVIDAGKIDGLKPFGELWHVYMPTLYPIFSVGVVGGIAGLFAGYAGTLELFGYDASQEVAGVGYLLFIRIMKGGGVDSYGFNAAGSIFFTLVVLPVAMFVKWLLGRVGPTEDTREPIKFPWRRK